MSRTYKPTLDLLSTPLFNARQQPNPVRAAHRSYERAKAIGLAHSTLSTFSSTLHRILNKPSADLSIDDVAHLSDKFWNMHRDYILESDGAAATLLTIQFNLVAGTLTQYLPGRSDLKPLLEDVLSWKVQ
jgi:acyl-CoA oxidase